MRTQILFVTIITSINCYAQDVIVKQNASTILSKVLEVNTSDIKYKKYSNLNGPTYTIVKSEVMAINYENGDKDEFKDETETPATNSINTETDDHSIGMPASADNEALISEYNNSSIEWIENNKDRKGRFIYCKLQVEPNSVLENADVSVQIQTGQAFYENNELKDYYMKSDYEKSFKRSLVRNSFLRFSYIIKQTKPSIWT